MSYSTQLATLYPLGSVVILDLSYQGDGIYKSEGTEGAWFVAGWCGKSDLRLNRDRRAAYRGEWELTSHVQCVIGSPEWSNFEGTRCHNQTRVTEIYDRIRAASPGLLDALSDLQRVAIPDPYLTPLLTPAASLTRESWGDGTNDSPSYLEDLTPAVS